MKRAPFNLSHYNLLSLNPGNLVPIALVEVLPGDTIQQATSALLRCSPLVTPVMHPWHVRIHHWYVPHRLVWESWEDFITGGPDGMDASVFPTRTFTTGPAVGTLSDYLGVPTAVNNIEVSALPYRGYALIWNECYRDEDLETPLVISDADGADTTTNTTLQNCAWEKDYFTSARPWEQKGPSVTVPLGTSAPVVRASNAPYWSAYNAGANTQTGALQPMYAGATPNFSIQKNAVGDISLDPRGGLYTDLSAASAVTVTRLRQALALQRFEEARARYGSRYVEYLRYLGVRSSDARLQRPEYLGGGKQTIQFSEVLQTAEGTDPVGEMRGHGITTLRSNRYRRFFEEHGYIFSLLSVRPKTIYTQGLSRTWNRRTKEDFFQRELQAIGQQPILNKEIYAAHANPNNTFGYQDRYDEYRRQESRVSGEFRTSVLDSWHTARIFGTAPALNADFVKCVPTERNFAVQSQDLLYVMARHSIQARRMVAPTGQSFIY